MELAYMSSFITLFIVIVGYFTIKILFKKGEIGWICICRQGRDMQLLMMHDFCTTSATRWGASTSNSIRLKKIDLKTGRILFDAPCGSFTEEGVAGDMANENSFLGVTANYIYMDFWDFGWSVFDFTTGRKLLDDKLLLSKNKELKGYAEESRPWFNPETGNIVVTDIKGNRFEVLVDECGLLPFSKACKHEKAARMHTSKDDFECFSLFKMSNLDTYAKYMKHIYVHILPTDEGSRKMRLVLIDDESGKVVESFTSKGEITRFGKDGLKNARTYLDPQFLVLHSGKPFTIGPQNRPEFIIMHRSSLAHGAGWCVSCAPADGPPRWEFDFSDLKERLMRIHTYKLHMLLSDEGLYFFFTKDGAKQMSFYLVDPETGKLKIPPRYIINWRTPRKYFKPTYKSGAHGPN